MAFFNFIDLKYNNLNNQINDYLKKIYSKSNEVFTNASPFGQILNVLKEFFQHTVLYQKNIVRNLDIDTVTNVKVMRAYSLIAGHNPTRPISASGTLKFTLKMSIDSKNEISGGAIALNDKTLLLNNTNGLYYSLRFGKPTETFRINDMSSFYANVIQGQYETQTFTGTGLKNQSFSVNIKTINQIDNFDVVVRHNGTTVTIYDSYYDMGRNQKACVIKTGMNGGIDIFFGNGYCGFIPEISSIIEVTYLLTDGISGNILTPVTNDFRFMSEATDINGNIINMNNLFDIEVSESINYGSEGDSLLFLKNSLSNVSRNFVLSTPQQYIYQLSRLGFFSKVNAYNTLTDNDYTNDNKIYLFLTPKVSNYYTTTVNYFNVPLSVYTLQQYDIDKILTYLNKNANIPIGVEIEIIQPRISKYVMIVYVRKNYGSSDETIKNNIISNVSTYLSDLFRDDRIVRSDMMSVIENVDGVDSVNIEFISEKNEVYHRKSPTSNDIIGLDPILGDIVVEKDELALIRGGWSDRNGTYYNENSNSNGLGPINIIFVGTTKNE